MWLSIPIPAPLPSLASFQMHFLVLDHPTEAFPSSIHLATFLPTMQGIIRARTIPAASTGRPPRSAAPDSGRGRGRNLCRIPLRHTLVSFSTAPDGSDSASGHLLPSVNYHAASTTSSSGCITASHCAARKLAGRRALKRHLTFVTLAVPIGNKTAHLQRVCLRLTRKAAVPIMR